MSNNMNNTQSLVASELTDDEINAIAGGALSWTGIAGAAAAAAAQRAVEGGSPSQCAFSGVIAGIVEAFHEL